MKNLDSTRAYSDRHEKSVCKALNATQQPNSGAGLFRKGDVVQEESSLLIECKCCMSEKKSVSIKKDWIEKNKEEILDLISKNLKRDWTIDRISKVNLAILKIAIYEIKFNELPFNE